MIVLIDVSVERRLAAQSARLLEAEKAAHAEAAAARDQALAVSRQEAAARLRLRALQAVTAGLATAVTSDHIADVLVDRGLSTAAAAPAGTARSRNRGVLSGGRART